MIKAYVYFVKPAGADGPIKIGCTCDPKRRLRVMACDSPVPLEMIGMVPGANSVERQILRQFDHLHSHGSWFRAESKLTGFIEAACEAQSFAGLIDWSIKKGGHRSRVNAQITRTRYGIAGATPDELFSANVKVRAPEAAE